MRACVGGLHDTVCFRGLAAKPRAFPRGLVRPKLGGLGTPKKPEEAPAAASQPHAVAAHSAATADTVHDQPPSAEILKSQCPMLCIPIGLRTLTSQNFCQTLAPQPSALTAAVTAGCSAHAKDLPSGSAPAPQSSRETQPDTRDSPGDLGDAPTPASPRPSPRPSSAAPAPTVSAAAPSASADAVAPTQAEPRNK